MTEIVALESVFNKMKTNSVQEEKCDENFK